MFLKDKYFASGAFEKIKARLVAGGEPCVFNKHNAAGVQISLTLHVDDLLTTCTSEAEIDLLFAYLRTQFPVITVHKGKTLSYLARHAFRL